MKKIKLLPLILLIGLLSGCYARELVLVEPVVNIRELGSRNVLFLGFDKASETKLPAKFVERLEEKLFSDFSTFASINVIRLDKVEDALYSAYRPEDLELLSKKYNTSLFVLLNADDYKEFKYLDQPLSDVSQPVVTDSFPVNNNLRNLVRYEIGVLMNINLVNPEGISLWKERLREAGSVQYQDVYRGQNAAPTSEELELFANTREKLIQNISDKIISNLVPYYTYK